jgi:DNA processing protein
MSATAELTYEPAQDVLLARAYLLRLAEPPATALHRLTEILGPVEAARRVRVGEVPDVVATETDARQGRDVAELDLAAAEKAGARLVVPESPDWPAGLLADLDAQGAGHTHAGSPLGLWVRGRGDLSVLAQRSVAIIGSRAASGYGETTAAAFAHSLAREGVAVVGSASYGCAGAAHRGALTAEAPTVAVLPCGIDVTYPAGHADLLATIAESSGLLVSEYPPGTPPVRRRFAARNRLLAALARATVVVEAGRRSGAGDTATLAHTLGRPVLAVPGSIHSATSIGCHDLIQAHTATLAGCVADVPAAVDADPSEQAATHQPDR